MCTWTRQSRVSRRGWLAILAALLSAAPLHADDRNGAAWYRRAIESLERMSEQDLQVITDYDPHAPPTAELRAALARAQPVLDLVRRGTAQPYADFELDFSQGFDMLVPHLAPLRNAARMLRADAAVRIHDGDAAGGAAQISSMYRMTEHLRHDSTLISSLVANAIFRTTEDAAQVGFDRAAFDSAQSQLMLDGLAGLDASDPFLMGEAVAMEQAFLVDWLAHRLGDGEDRKQAFAEIAPWLEGGEAATLAVFQLSDEEFASEIDRYDRMMDEVVTAFYDADDEAARARLVELGEEIVDGEHGIVSKMLSPAWESVYDKMLQSRVAVEARRAALHELAIGAARPETLANAALHYAAAIETLRADAWPRLEAVASARLRRDMDLDAEVVETLRGAAPVVSELQAGAACARCDFSVLRPADPPRLCPPYVAGMSEVIDVLLLDAVRQLQAGEIDAATAHVAVAYRIIAHLSGDDPLASALVAHRAFDRANRVADELLAAGGEVETRRATLRDAAAAVGRKDPFGYIGSVAETRRLVLSHVGVLRQRRIIDEQRSDELNELVAGWSAAQLLSTLAVYDALVAAAEGEPTTRDVARRVPFAVDPDRLAALRRRLAELAPRLAEGDLELFDAGGFEGLSPVAARMRNARSDLRRGLARYRAKSPVSEESGSPGAQ